jgi:hypothetical protein
VKRRAAGADGPSAGAIALRVAMEAVAAGVSSQLAVIAAAEHLASDPWGVVEGAGPLARVRWAPAACDVGLTASLSEVDVDAPSAVARVAVGQQRPWRDRAGQQLRGAFDTPKDLARSLAGDTVAASGRTGSGQDPACGVGALLLALRERGVADLRGGDVDALAVQVARVALPGARLEVADGLEPGEPTDLVIGNPPFVSSERQDKALRARLGERFAWLGGRFDLAVPMAEAWTERVLPGGALGLWLPWACFFERYGLGWRRRWLAAHRIVRLEGPVAFRGAVVTVGQVVVRVGAGPGLMADSGLRAEAVSSLVGAPFDPELRVGDPGLLERARALSTPLGELARIDTGVVSHSPAGGKARLLHDAPGPGRVPYADAEDFFAGRRRWLHYLPSQMHRPKDPALFEPAKVVVQRITGRRPVRAEVDRDGVFVGHTCTVVVPRPGVELPLEAIAALLRDPAVRGLLRIERGYRLDMYPHDVGAVPVPVAWSGGEIGPLQEAWGLDEGELGRLRALGRS